MNANNGTLKIGVRVHRKDGTVEDLTLESEVTEEVKHKLEQSLQKSEARKEEK